MFSFFRSARTKNYIGRTHDRFWWYQLEDCRYVPPIIQSLTDKEWKLFNEWVEDTADKGYASEAGIPLMSLISGLVGGSAVSPIVQCGHYAGFSTIFLGLLLKKMNKENCLFSVDIDPEVTSFTQIWVEKFGLTKQVKLHVDDSASLEVPVIAKNFLGDAPRLVFIDSSHQYDHTLQELDLWGEHLQKRGMIMLHDTSPWAASFDQTESGGVFKAVTEWCEKKKWQHIFLNDFVGVEPPNELVYKDGCGVGIIQKPGDIPGNDES